jgi:hypothetical protein
MKIKIVQDDKQFEEEYVSDDVDKLQSEILPGVEEDGVLVFPKLNHLSSIVLHLDEPSSSNYDLDWNMVKFDITSK